MKNLEFLKWLKQFIKDKDILSDIELLEIEEALVKLQLNDIFVILETESPVWTATVTFPTPLFKNSYNYEITKVDKKSEKK
jgi:hypothetical protein